jgi:hypothetical protein
MPCVKAQCPWISSHPDFYFALRGDGNNFGIVTRFDLEMFSQGAMWGGNNYYLLGDAEHRRELLSLPRPFDCTPSWFVQQVGSWLCQATYYLGYCTTFEAIITAFEDISREENSDPFASSFITFFLATKVHFYGALVSTVYSRFQEDPPIFKNFTMLRSLYASTRSANLSDLTADLESTVAPGSWSEAIIAKCVCQD